MKINKNLIDETYFEQYDLNIAQYKKGYRFSTDAILLGEFVDLPKKAKIIEIGSGSGIISMIIKRRFPDSKIVAIELQEKYAQLTQHNINTNFKNNVDDFYILNNDILNYKDIFEAKQFDAVIVNPPFYETTNGTLPQEEDIKLAKFEFALSVKHTIKIGRYLLKDNGHFFLIHLPYRLDEIISTFVKNKYSIRNLLFIFPKKQNKANYFLCKAKKGINAETNITRKQLEIEEKIL